MKSVENYAMEILAKAGCDCYTYGGADSEHIMDDLKTGYPDGMEFPYVQVANAILAMSRPKPVVRSDYRVYWDNGVEACGSNDCDTLEQAKDAVYDMLYSWMETEKMMWDNGVPTQEDKDRWDMMIYNAYAEVKKYNPYTDEYEDEWEMSSEDCQKFGWYTFENNEKR